MGIRLTKPTRASPDGIHTVLLEAGEYDETIPPMTPELADVLVRGGLATRTKVPPADREAKVVTPEETKLDTSSMTVQEVLDAVDNGTLSRVEAFASEQAGKNRKTLIEALTP